MLVYLITYRKKNNEIFQRLISTLTYEIGDYTNMGWYVLDIQIYYKGRFYSFEEFNCIFDKELKKEQAKNKNRIKRHKIIKHIVLNTEKKINKFLKL